MSFFKNKIHLFLCLSTSFSLYLQLNKYVHFLLSLSTHPTPLSLFLSPLTLFPTRCVCSSYYRCCWVSLCCISFLFLRYKFLYRNFSCFTYLLWRIETQTYLWGGISALPLPYKMKIPRSVWLFFIWWEEKGFKWSNFLERYL